MFMYTHTPHTHKMDLALCEAELVCYVHMLRDAVFGAAAPERSDAEMEGSKQEARRYMIDLFPGTHAHTHTREDTHTHGHARSHTNMHFTHPHICTSPHTHSHT